MQLIHGSFNTNGDEIQVRVTGNFENLEEVRSLPIALNGKIFRLGDIGRCQTPAWILHQLEFITNGQPVDSFGRGIERQCRCYLQVKNCG